MALKVIDIEQRRDYVGIVFTIDRLNDAFMAQKIMRSFINERFCFGSGFGFNEKNEEELALPYKCKNVINLLYYTLQDDSYTLITRPKTKLKKLN